MRGFSTITDIHYYCPLTHPLTIFPSLSLSLAATAAASPWIGIWPFDQQPTKNLFAGLAFDQCVSHSLTVAALSSYASGRSAPGTRADGSYGVR